MRLPLHLMLALILLQTFCNLWTFVFHLIFIVWLFQNVLLHFPFFIFKFPLILTKAISFNPCLKLILILLFTFLKFESLLKLLHFLIKVIIKFLVHVLLLKSLLQCYCIIPEITQKHLLLDLPWILQLYCIRCRK